jgi:radical SAM protein with 4Fe4S-binding SPASM domain
MANNPFIDIYENDRYRNPYNYALVEFPYILDIELTNNCNIDCIMCPRSIMTRKLGMMSFKLFKKIINEAAGYKTGIRFIRAGEPFLNKDILKMIDYTKKKNLFCHVTTNGLVLTNELIIKVVTSGLDSIIFSFQGTNRKEYELMRNNNQYDKLKEHIVFLKKVRDEQGSDTPFIQVSTSILDETEEEIKQFSEQWNMVADRVDKWFTSLDRISHLPRVKKLLKRQSTLKYLSNAPCNEVATKLSINWNGDVTACCSDFDGKLLLGNITDKSLKEIWKSKKINALRKILSRGERHKIPFCSLCLQDVKTHPRGKSIKATT